MWSPSVPTRGAPLVSLECEDSLGDIMGVVSVVTRRRATDTSRGMKTRGERRMATVPVSGDRGSIVEIQVYCRLGRLSRAQHHSTTARFRVVP